MAGKSFYSQRGNPTKWVPRLDHETPDDAVDDDPVVVTVTRVGRKILDAAGALVREQAQRDIAPCGVDNHPMWQLSRYLITSTTLYC